MKPPQAFDVRVGLDPQSKKPVLLRLAGDGLDVRLELTAEGARRLAAALLEEAARVTS